MSCVGLMSWALHYELQGPIMSVVTYICIFVAAGYITASFIVQIPLINQSNPSWVDWIGLDNFSDANINFKENVSGYAITVLVYITSLIYRKTASRYSQKERYLRQRYPERFINKGKEKVKLKDLIKKKKTTFWDSVLYNFTITIKNPYAHLMVFRLSLFFWIYMWFTFQSLLPMLMLWHSVVFIDRKLYIKALMYVQLPLLWLVMLFNYVINIDNLMMDIFGETFFDNDDHRRFGIWRYEVPFFHLLLQIFTLFYGSFVCYLFREYDKLQAKIEEAKERKAKRRRAKLERAQQRDRSASVRSASMRSGAPSVNDTFISSQNVEKEEPIYTYEIIFRFILKYIDLPLMVVLYIAGCNRIDVYHVILLIIFVLFIMYPDFFRRHFNFILYFIIIVASVKYCYVLLEPEFANHSRINDWFKVFGLDADIEDKIYGRNNLINNNYIIIFTGYIQYAIYTSDFSKNAFSAEQSAKDLKTFANRFPLLMKILIISVESFIMLIPWFTYLIFLIINIINSKNLLNFALLMLNLLLLFWHISASLVTKKSHRRLTRGWKCFTFIAAVFFLIILIFQIGSIEQVANIGFIDDFIDWLPTFITDNHDIIGLESYIGFTKSGRMVKFLAYVAYFNLSVITHRQLERSSNKVRAYEAKKLEPIHELGSESSSDESESIMKVQFSLVYVVHKLKVLWPVFNTISWHSFTILAICMGALAIHWRLSVVSLIYIFMLMVYYALTPFFLQPNIKKSGIEYKKGVTVKEMKELWESEDKRATKRLLALRNQFVIFISFFTIICIGILHLSANFPLLADRYKATSGDFWESLIFISFWSGVNYTEMYGGNSYFQEIWGFIFVLLICAIEKKAQIWLRNKFGYEGSTFESYSGAIKLEDYRGDEDKSKKINNLISEPLEEIKEEDEMVRDSIANTIGEKEKGLDDPEPAVEKELSPEELFEKEKEKKVKAILSMEYRLFLTKTIRVIIFVAVILMAMLSSFYKSNVWGILVLFFAALVSLLDLKFKNLKWFTIVM